MKADRQTFYSLQFTYDETRQVLELYARQKLEALHGISLREYQLEDYAAEGAKSRPEDGAYFLFLKETPICGGK